jgi:two-component system NtrC family sensor kinase
MTRPALAVPAGSRWELSAAVIALKMRWFGLASVSLLNAILTLGLLFALLDSIFTLRGRLFLLSRYPLVVAVLEAVFIGLLCYFDTGLESPFRYFFLLSVVTCAVRYALPLPLLTCILHAGSYLVLYLVLPHERQELWTVVVMAVVMFWAAWATASLTLLLKLTSSELQRVNAELRAHEKQLEEKVEERTRELHEAQAQVLHQEKQATFGLLAAGIAHEVGNPLTSISGLVQMLQRRSSDAYVQEKLAQVSGELERIQRTLRDLIAFSRPADAQRTLVSLADVVEETLSIAKYYKRLAGKTIRKEVPQPAPIVRAARGQLTQALLNLLLNAIDVTATGGAITVALCQNETEVGLEVRDEGPPVAPANVSKLFQPYFTTKPHGTGLGLFMTRKLIEDHDGRVEYRPLGESGKTFRFWLPRSPALLSLSPAKDDGHAIRAAG